MPLKPEIPNFEITAYCGSGAYGDVWIGKDRDGIKRAVKVLDIKRLNSLGVLQREEKAVTLFRRQAQTHQNLIDILYAGETESYIYYIMELADTMPGENAYYIPDTLSERLKPGKPLAMDQCLNIINQILDAVEHLHKNDLLHRDIKPSNILFIDGIAKLADIGLVSSSSSEVSLAGTIGFIPPNGATGPEADIYALGKLLYCISTGNSANKYPSLPVGNYNQDTMRQFKYINKVILKACNKKSDNRFATVDDFRQVLVGNVPVSPPLRIILEMVLLFFVIAFSGSYWYNEYQKQRCEQQSSSWLIKARINTKNGKISDALRNTEQALKVDPKNKKAKKLRQSLILQVWKGKPKPATVAKTNTPVLSSAERKEHAQYLILYNTFMTKNNPTKALECLDMINQNWPHMKENHSLKNLRTYALNKLKTSEKAEK